ncbi:MAG: peptidoglycan DD-metalloendopeptidase family protein [Rhodospirillales bacterium]|nr:peptidoglycan DD-metalloendopeptidase family protein [Rhodospirillales bacterium]
MHEMQRGNLTHRWARAVMRFFPDRELMLRTDGKIRFVKVSKTLQMFVFVVVVALSGWAIFSSFSFFAHNEVVASKNREIFDARMVYRSLLSEVSEYQDKFSSLTQELGKNHGLMLDQVEKNATLQQNLRSVENKLETSNTRHNEIVSARAALKNKLSSIENEMKELNSHNFNLKGNLNSVTTDLESALSQRNFVRSQSKKLSRTVAKLENDLETLHKSEKDILINLTERTKSSIDDIHFVLKHTGLKVAQLLKGNQDRSKKKLGQGGPFIAFAPDTEPAQRLKANLSNLNSQLQQFTELQDIMKRLPLAAPLDYFSISSHYGKRRDPINKRWAVHYGMDFGGLKHASVYVTAPGRVRYAGRKGKYGKLVEIDHGLGFRTKYGHLHKILVKRGQKVNYRTKIGLMGSSGRSTGPHLHYEVIVKGKHKNPWRFIKAGRYVYKRH